jgi:amino acid transporter
MVPDNTSASASGNGIDQSTDKKGILTFFDKAREVVASIAAWMSQMRKIKLRLPGKTTMIDTCWYFFIIIVVGQLGPLIVYATAVWNGTPVVEKIQESAGKAELLTCATAILAAGVFFLIREYNSAEKIRDREIKSLALLWAAVLGLLCVLATVQLLAKNGFTSPLQSWIHWVLYGLTMATAWGFWLLEESQEPAAKEIAAIVKEANNLTAHGDKTTTSTGMKI